VTERTSVEAAVQETIAHYAKLHILHNNAGGSTLPDGPVTEAPEAELWRAIKLDLFGTFLAIPASIKAGGGSIINIGWGLDGVARAGLLHGSQGRHRLHDAVHGGRVRAAQYPGQRHRSIGHADGACEWLLAGNANVSKLAASHLLGLGQPIHIANMAVYLASDEAAITTGQILSVDSGVTIY